MERPASEGAKGSKIVLCVKGGLEAKESKIVVIAMGWSAEATRPTSALGNCRLTVAVDKISKMVGDGEVTRVRPSIHTELRRQID